jgi:hypothetical protein
MAPVDFERGVQAVPMAQNRKSRIALESIKDDLYVQSPVTRELP